MSDDRFVDRFIETNQARLGRAYTEATNFLIKHGISYRESNAAFFVWADLFSFWSDVAMVNGAPMDTRDVRTEERLNAHLLANKVFVAAGSASGCEEAGWFRLTFALDRDYLRTGLERLVEALTSFQR